MSKPSTGSVTHLLELWDSGQTQALDQLVNKVYDELLRIARGLMQSERDNHTLQTGALVNEAYLRLMDLQQFNWQNRKHFFAVASSIMRRILVDHARSHSAHKRGGNVLRVTLDEEIASSEDAVDVLALDSALKRLAERDLTQARIVELRYFGGLTVDQAAENLAISPASVKRKWTLAQTWLYRELHGVC